VTRSVLPTSHTQLQRALEREARAYTKRQGDLAARAQQNVAARTDEGPSDGSSGAEAGTEE
jgi:hypothetical protein